MRASTLDVSLTNGLSFTSPALGYHGSEPACLRFPHANNKFLGAATCAAHRNERTYLSPWDEKPFEILLSGKIAYLDEQDVVSFLDPPKDLIPLDPASYNPAAYLWKKIEDIPEERRHHLLRLLEPRLISRAWEVASTHYEDPKLAKKIATKFLSEDVDTSIEFYNCRTSQGPFPISWIKFFKKAICRSKTGKLYGRIIGPPILSPFAAFSPLYFSVTGGKEVMATEEPCDLCYEFGDGVLEIDEYPEGFPRSAKHPYPFNDYLVVYIRHIGPGVCVGQAWQEGRDLYQVPRKLCSEILMVKESNPILTDDVI